MHKKIYTTGAYLVADITYKSVSSQFLPYANCISVPSCDALY